MAVSTRRHWILDSGFSEVAYHNASLFVLESLMICLIGVTCTFLYTYSVVHNLKGLEYGPNARVVQIWTIYLPPTPDNCICRVPTEIEHYIWRTSGGLATLRSSGTVLQTDFAKLVIKVWTRQARKWQRRYLETSWLLARDTIRTYYTISV